MKSENNKIIETIESIYREESIQLDDPFTRTILLVIGRIIKEEGRSIENRTKEIIKNEFILPKEELLKSIEFFFKSFIEKLNVESKKFKKEETHYTKLTSFIKSSIFKKRLLFGFGFGFVFSLLICFGFATYVYSSTSFYLETKKRSTNKAISEFVDSQNNITRSIVDYDNIKKKYSCILLKNVEKITDGVASNAPLEKNNIFYDEKRKEVVLITSNKLN